MKVTYERLMTKQLQEQLAQAYMSHHPGGTEAYFISCLEQNLIGHRITYVAIVDKQIAGCAHLLLRSDYPMFQERAIPEINDLVVFASFRRNGIAQQLLNLLETAAAAYSPEVGLGVGLYFDYGPAQRLYSKRGYVLDGCGAMTHHTPVQPGSKVLVDDDLLVYMTKSTAANGETDWVTL